MARRGTRTRRGRAGRRCPARWSATGVALVAMGAMGIAGAQEAPAAGATTASASAPVPQQVVITATRQVEPVFDVPAAISRVDGDRLRDDRAGTGIADGLGGVAGLLARDRQNYAQDVQLSLRGFGARSSFGIRGVRIYVDGIPGTFPDGQGRISQVELEAVDHVEVLRGPFSALYGNSAGGVVNVFSAAGQSPGDASATVAEGSDGLRRVSVQGGTGFGTRPAGSGAGGGDEVDLALAGTHFTTDGYRDHSAAERSTANALFHVRPTGSDTLSLVLNGLDAPKSQDPLGLSRAQFEADPRAVDPSAIAFDTRKTLAQRQAGATWQHAFGGGLSLDALAYAGWRHTEQFQSIPVASQAAPTSPGGVIDLGTRYRGTDVHGTWAGSLGGGAASMVAGVSVDDMDQRRRGYLNYVPDADGGPPVTGVQGDLRRDEDDLATDTDAYLQAGWRPAADWSLSAGVRHARIRFTSHDHYVVAGNGDDSGGTSYAATLPVAGVMFRATANVHLYATVGRGFETPTFNELAYRPDATPGLNFALRPARSDNREVGLKARDGHGATLDVAVFRTLTRDEIVTLTNVGGRSTYQNAGGTRRDGVEIEAAAPFGAAWQVGASLSLLDARYQQDFITCNTSPCPVSKQKVVPAGNRLPGVPWAMGDVRVDWAPSDGWRAGVQGRVLSSVPVDDANSDDAPSFVTMGVHLDRVLRAGSWRWTPFVRVDNLFDRHYAGSVIVNEGNARFFEPAPGRTFVVGVSAAIGG